MKPAKSNPQRSSGRWWGKQAENAAQYLGKGSYVNIVGPVQNNNYPAADGGTVDALSFTAEEIDYLNTPADA